MSPKTPIAFDQEPPHSSQNPQSFGRVSVADMTGHVEALCREHGITVEPHSRSGRACRREKTIYIRPVKSAITYATALHELGHVLGPNPNRRLAQEAAAWKWAEEHAIAWPEAARKDAENSLRSYLEWALRKRSRGINIVIPDDYPVKE